MDSKNISGYDLALRVLSHERGGVEALLSLSGGGEICWLELKAGMGLLPEDKKQGQPSALQQRGFSPRQNQAMDCRSDTENGKRADFGRVCSTC